MWGTKIEKLMNVCLTIIHKLLIIFSSWIIGYHIYLSKPGDPFARIGVTAVWARRISIHGEEGDGGACAAVKQLWGLLSAISLTESKHQNQLNKISLFLGVFLGFRNKNPCSRLVKNMMQRSIKRTLKIWRISTQVFDAVQTFAKCQKFPNKKLNW
jgi:hypothetical protein